jgi:NADPH-dependent 2,4-dienoyl-CoA reductase/sulfur reductase-like enzyme
VTERDVADSALHADVAVVGAGPAGIAAAVHAAEHGARVLLLDSAPRPGGQIWRHRSPGELPSAAVAWLERLRRSTVTWLPGSSVVDAARGTLLAERDGRPVVVGWQSLVLATGATERFIPFPGWTLPNVFGVGGLQALLKAGAAVKGKRVVMGGSGPLLLPVAASLAHAGAKLAIVAEQAPAHRVYRFAGGLWRDPGRLVQAGRYRARFMRAAYRCGTWVARVDPSGTALWVTLTDGRRVWAEAADLVAVGYGLVPAVTLARLLGCDVAGGRVVVDRRQATSVPGVYCAGEPTGIAGADAALAEGRAAGLAAAGAEGAGAAPGPSSRRFERRLDRAFRLREELRELPDPDTLVCRCEDVRLRQIEPGWSIREVKLHTRAGMGPCQGRVCQPALEFLRGMSADAVRTPAFPSSVATVAAAGHIPQGES